MALMALALTDEERRRRLEMSAERLGGKATLGRTLGYKDGAFVGQMIRGERPITEKTLKALGDIRGLADLWSFSAVSGFRIAENDLNRPEEDSDHQAPAAQSPKGGHSSERPRTGGGSADHFLSLLTPTIDPITIPWESIVSMQLSEKLPPLFKLALVDDALAPGYPAGTLFVWSTTKQPRIGSIVLVLDGFKQPHARRHAQGRAPGQWVAEATGAGFLPFDGADVTLLAVADEERRQMP